ncbi:MAG: PAS domain S-box protein, partial [Deltaproteobacteria bacterium]|nr:PAS domain S-box protein [Deltaproteobacteria bacterium]
MKIRTKSQLNTVFLVVVILMIGLILFFTSHKMNAAIEKEKAIDNLKTGIFELTLMAHDYLLNHRTRALIQWQVRYASLGKVLSTEFQTAEENLLLEEIKENYGKLKTIFSKLVINYQALISQGKVPEDFKELKSRLAGHLMARLQTMVSISNQLAQRSEREMVSIYRNTSLIILLSIFMFAVMIAVNSILMGRSIVGPIRKLQKDAEIVGKGNLDYPMATAANDELGEFSRSFEQMAKNLKTVMGSRDELEHEIEERKQAELKLKESEEKYSKLFHSNPQWLHISTLEDGRYVEVNEAVKEITGYERDEVIGRTSEELGFWADYEERSRLVKVAQEQGGFREQEVAFIKKNGEPVSLLWSAATIEIMGKVHLINAVTDITELKQTEEALRESERKYRQQSKVLEGI